ncbi:MAG: hypothetical protein ACYTBP_15710 [Planctomycetota bacterium]
MWDFLNNYAFAITILFIVVSTLVAAFVRRRRRDKCLKDFGGDMVTLEDTDGKVIWGNMNVENTGLELVYSQQYQDADGHLETSYILYKHEYPKIGLLIRYHAKLSEKSKKERERELKRTYHPGFFRRLKRKVVNVFKTVRDSVMEVVNILISRAKQASPAAGVLKSQDKYVTQMKQELMGSVGTAYEPLLERYIGHKVIIEMVKREKLFEYPGVLKEYTADFIEIMDINYKADEAGPPLIADLIIPRKYGLVRHLGE